MSPDVRRSIDGRALRIAGLAILLGLATGGVASLLTQLIAFVTNLAFYGRLSTSEVSPADNQLGLWIIPVAVLGGLVVGLMARFGATAIRGHGIPEAMERVLEYESRIPLRMTVLKPLSSAIAIGTGGPFGAEGPIIATGGAVGSMLGQFLRTSARERKTLLAAGAAAGMAATFGSPVSAVLLAVELLLFELAPRTLVPVVLGAATGALTGMLLRGSGAAFPMAPIEVPGAAAFIFYIALGALIGLVAVGVTALVYWVEDLFGRLPIHWMWWPPLGGVAIGVIGLVAPKVLGVGYDNIRGVVVGAFAAGPLALLVAMKLLIWVIALGSATSGGTLAPLFTIGGGCGALIGMGVASAFPEAGIDPSVAGLVGMAAMFAGASRAVLTSVVFAFETTRQPMGIVPLLVGCGAAYLVACALSKHSIMTRKIAERGVAVPTEYAFDPLARLRVGALATRPVACLDAAMPVSAALTMLSSPASDGGGARPHGYPVIRCKKLVGVVTRTDLVELARIDAEAPLSAAIRRAPLTAFEDESLRAAVDVMVREEIGRLPVVTRAAPDRVVAILTRGDALRGFRERSEENLVRPALPVTVRFGPLRRR